MSGHASTMRTALTRAGRQKNPNASSPPLRQVLLDHREIAAATAPRSQSTLTSLRMYAVTTPGKFVILLIVLALACLGAGWYSSTVLDQRTQTLQLMIDRTEPLSEAAQVLYSSLSIADASANAAFISGGLESPELRTRYSDAIATASTSLITASGSLMDTTDPVPSTPQEEDPARADIETLATAIPVYSGLVETARTNNRLGNPVGSAYLGQASALMQDQILPAAQRLYERRSSAIAHPQRALTVPPWGVYVVLLALIAVLLATSRYLTRRTRRRFNIGVVAALIAIVGGTIWLLVSGLMSVAATDNAKTEGADPLRELTSARILTQQARSAETLSLVRRGDQNALEQSFSDSTTRIATTLTRLTDTRDENAPLSADQLGAALSSLRQWQHANNVVSEEIRTGDFQTARALTVDDGPVSSARSYREVDSALVEAITTTRTAFRDDINTAQRVIGFTGTGIALLTAFAALAIALGLIPRIREYR